MKSQAQEVGQFIIDYLYDELQNDPVQGAAILMKLTRDWVDFYTKGKEKEKVKKMVQSYFLKWEDIGRKM
jgi:hypothetical protein